MDVTDTEMKILRALARCRFLPGSFDKKFHRQIPMKNISPLQKWWIYKLGYKYRKQIKRDDLAFICKNYIDSNEKPVTRKESEKLLKTVIRSSSPTDGQLPISYPRQ